MSLFLFFGAGGEPVEEILASESIAGWSTRRIQ
jgi:hypothetical protein